VRWTKTKLWNRGCGAIAELTGDLPCVVSEVGQGREHIANRIRHQHAPRHHETPTSRLMTRQSCSAVSVYLNRRDVRPLRQRLGAPSERNDFITSCSAPPIL